MMGNNNSEFDPIPAMKSMQQQYSGIHLQHKAIAQQPQQAAFLPKRALIVSKLSLLEYEYERSKKSFSNGYRDAQFLTELAKRHANIADLQQRHELQHAYIQSISQELERHNIECRVVRRKEYLAKNTLVQWADLIISAGGDGTFLLAARKVPSGKKPVIGINTDPVGSEGFLCLTGKQRHQADIVIRQFLEQVKSPNFHWMHRQRIRVTVLRQGASEGDVSTSSSSSSIGMNDEGSSSAAATMERKHSLEVDQDQQNGDDHDDSVMSRRSKFSSDDDEPSSGESANNGVSHLLALNEVFIGESHAARVTYYDVQVDNGPMTKQKSSGMTICTGTGSTSWHYNINRLTEQNLGEIFTALTQLGINLDREMDSELIEEICRRYNEKLKFSPELQMMAFSVRDAVFNATFPKTPIRGFANKILLKSRCMHAHLILDGSTSIPFNRGAEVLLEIHPEDALRTAVFNKEE